MFWKFWLHWCLLFCRMMQSYLSRVVSMTWRWGRGCDGIGSGKVLASPSGDLRSLRRAQLPPHPTTEGQTETVRQGERQKGRTSGTTDIARGKNGKQEQMLRLSSANDNDWRLIAYDEVEQPQMHHQRDNRWDKEAHKQTDRTVHVRFVILSNVRLLSGSEGPSSKPDTITQLILMDVNPVNHD